MKKIISACLAALVLVSVFVLPSCGSKGETLMSLGGEKISVNMYRLWLSRVKGAYGGSDESIWDETAEDGRTYNEIFTEYVRKNAKTLLCAMYEFGKNGLKLSESDKKEISDNMDAMLSERADGNMNELNSVLSQYGVNYNILKEVYTIEKKLSVLRESLYGENGTEKITDETRDEYYNSNYVRIKQIFFYTSNKPVTDEDGNYTYDENGYVVTRDFTEEEIAEQKNKAKLVSSSLTSGQDFDLLLSSQNEDTAAEAYPNGYYFTRTSQYADGVIDAAFGLDIGEFTTVESEYGIHIIKRLPLEDKGYSLSANADFFTDFEENLVTDLFTARLSAYEKDIKVNEELLAKYDVKSSVPNTTY